MRVVVSSSSGDSGKWAWFMIAVWLCDVLSLWRSVASDSMAT